MLHVSTTPVGGYNRKTVGYSQPEVCSEIMSRRRKGRREKKMEGKEGGRSGRREGGRGEEKK